MAQEIERKFLVRGSFKEAAFDALRITQGYLSTSPGCSVRVRLRGDQGFLTIKGPSPDGGLSRFEWEKEIGADDARALMELCEPGIIDKTRYLVKVGKHTFEVDEFHGDNEGLVVAEVELGAPDEAFEKPDWLGEEVTGVRRYYNSALTKNPYKVWK
jgi:CYTH domain-containing protein